MRKKAGILFMVLGLLCIVAAIGLLTYNNAEDKRAGESSARVMTYLREEIRKNELSPPTIDPFDAEMPVAELDGNGYIGYLSIPSLELELPVMADWDYDKLKTAPCRYYGSATTDNLVIAAHDYRVHFGYIGNLNQGDAVTFTDINGKVYSYKVSSIELLSPEDVDKVKDTGDDLILYTCNYGGTKRITVRCAYA